MSEKDIPGPRNSESGDIGYGFVDLGRPGFEQLECMGLPAPAASAYGPSMEGAGTRVCGYVNKED